MQFEIDIQKIAFGGDGLGFLGGKTCFVEGALPGERALVQVLQNKPNFIKARAVKIIQKSEYRLNAPCVYYDQCGGCQYQHVSYEKELEYKQAQVEEFFDKKLKVPKDRIFSITPSPKEYGYRNSLTLHPSKQKSKEPQKFGFFAKDNLKIIPIKNCLLADEALLPIYSYKFRHRSNKDSFIFRLSDRKEIILDEKEAFFKITVGKEALLVHSQGFFQNNLEVTQKITDFVKTNVDTEKPEHFFDLYAGVGTFSFLSAAKIPNLYAFEESPGSVAALRMNKSERSLETLQIFEGRVEEKFISFFKEKTFKNAILFLDPPRQGIDRRLAEFLSNCKKFGSIFYLSCDPSTLVRDLEIITARDNWSVREVRAYDMFPRTKHIEVLTLLA